MQEGKIFHSHNRNNNVARQRHSSHWLVGDRLRDLVCQKIQITSKCSDVDPPSDSTTENFKVRVRLLTYELIHFQLKPIHPRLCLYYSPLLPIFRKRLKHHAELRKMGVEPKPSCFPAVLLKDLQVQSNQEISQALPSMTSPRMC